MSGVSVLERYDAYLIDLDGVVYLLDEPVPGAGEVIRYIQEKGRPLVFLTNNSVATPGQYVEKLKRFGVEAGAAGIMTSATALGHYLEKRGVGGCTGYLIGERGLREEVERRGVVLVEGTRAREVDFVFVGWDRGFDFEKLKTAVIAVRNGAEFVASNADATYPTPEGLWPGAGSLVAAVSTGSGREPLVIGKPNPLMVNLAIEGIGVAADRVILIGDRLDTDIAAGVLAGVDTALVLSGVSTAEEASESEFRPTYIAASLRGLLEC